MGNVFPCPIGTQRLIILRLCPICKENFVQTHGCVGRDMPERSFRGSVPGNIRHLGLVRIVSPDKAGRPRRHKLHIIHSAVSPLSIAPASLGCDLAFVRIVKPNRNPTKWFRFGEEEQRSGASHTQKGVASEAKFVLARQSWPSITCCPRITRGRRSLCTGYRARETMGPPQKRPSTLFCIIAL